VHKPPWGGLLFGPEGTNWIMVTIGANYPQDKGFHLVWRLTLFPSRFFQQ